MAEISVLTLNMQNGQVWDPRFPDLAPIRMDRCIDFLKRSRADIISLQEVEYPFHSLPNSRDHRFYNIIKEHLGASGYTGCFSYPETLHPHIPFGIGLALFSRFPILEWEHIPLPAADIVFPYGGKSWHAADRSLLSCLLEGPAGAIRVLNTHLQAFFMIESSADQHPTQRELLAQKIRESVAEDVPTILTGDLNCTTRERTLAVLTEAGVKTLQKRIITWRRMPLVLDHIMASRHFRMRSFRVIDSDLSDHLPLLGSLSYGEA